MDGRLDFTHWLPRLDELHASFLVLRTGNHRLDFFRGLDAEGEPVPAP